MESHQSSVQHNGWLSEWFPTESGIRQGCPLGVHFCPTRSTYEINENWDSKIQSMIDTIKLWNRRQLSPHGKVVIAKTFLVSKFIYLLQSIHIPNIVMQKIDQMLYKFIWQKKFSDKKAFEKVKRSVLNASEVRGGRNMISVQDMEYALEISYQKFGGVTNVFKTGLDINACPSAWGT